MGPNGARWVYTVKEELNSDLKEALYEQYKYYFTGNRDSGRGLQTAATPST